jgi:SAM-dependent methyltransferase
VRYEPTDAAVFPRLLEGIDADLSSFGFVDFGCGKGRILLLASNYPFKEITGVEFSPELAGVAERNVSIYRSAEQHCQAIRVVTGDAAEFAIPEGPLVCYFYNPFGENVMRKVVANLMESMQRDPRDMLLIYLNPRHRSVIDVTGCWTPLQVAASHVIYRSAMVSGGGTA